MKLNLAERAERGVMIFVLSAAICLHLIEPLLPFVVPQRVTTMLVLLALVMLLKRAYATHTCPSAGEGAMFIRTLGTLDETYKESCRMIESAEQYVWATYLQPHCPRNAARQYYDNTPKKCRAAEFRRLISRGDREKKAWIAAHKITTVALAHYSIALVECNAPMVDYLIVDDSEALVCFPYGNGLEAGFWFRNHELVMKLKEHFQAAWASTL